MSTTTFTTGSVFLKTLSTAGITHAFVNWGSDHSALLEDLERQRAQNRADGTFDVVQTQTQPEIITCPNEMVALSAAQGYAQVTGKPAAVIVHTDVGTQALGGAVHNADRNRTPVLIFAGATSFTANGELRGSRNEYQMWYQDVVDQPAILRQYMRCTSQIQSGKNVAQVVMHALQIAKSEPQGPVYLWARREAMEEVVDASIMDVYLDTRKWSPLEPTGLAPSVASTIAKAFLTAKSPLIITSYLGRNPSAVLTLIALSEFLAIPVFLGAPTCVSFPFTHPNFVGLSMGHGQNVHLSRADVILIVDSDVPWVPMHNKPLPDARIFHIDVDPLKNGMGFFHVDAEIRARADGGVALAQILDALRSDPSTANILDSEPIRARAEESAASHAEWVHSLDTEEQKFPEDGSLRLPNILGILRNVVPQKTLVLNESITNFPLVWNHMRPSVPGSMVTAGASSIGWSLGAAVGASIGGVVSGRGSDLIVVIVGDGSYLEGVPSSAYWIARRYNTPFLTIVINNGGWKAPINSMLGVHPSGMGSKAGSGRQLTTGFGPDSPDYSQIAVAAGSAWGTRVQKAEELESVINKAITVVLQEKRCAVLDCVIESIN